MAIERTARVTRLVEHGATTRAIFLVPDTPLAYRAGQFVSCLVPEGTRVLNRAYSIASPPGTPELELLVDLVPGGPGSTYLFARAPGDAISFTGPWGTFVLEDDVEPDVVCIADRTGIAPIRAIVQAARRRPRRLLYGTTQGIYADELAAAGVAVERVPPERLVDEAITRFVHADDDRTRHFFVCGIGDVVHRLRDVLRGAGYARRAVRYEKW